MARSHRLGRDGEDAAARHLVALGWRLLARNYRFGHREIDLVARRGRVVAFVEVKTRTDDRCGAPLEAIHTRKRAEIERVARAWIARYGTGGDVYRFDAIAVTARGERLRLEHVEDAWRIDGG